MREDEGLKVAVTIYVQDDHGHSTMFSPWELTIEGRDLKESPDFIDKTRELAKMAWGIRRKSLQDLEIERPG